MKKRTVLRGRKSPKAPLDRKLTKLEIEGLIFDTLELLDCPRALTVWLLFLEDNHDVLLEFFAANPLHYRTAEDFRRAHAASKLLSKSTFLRLSVDRKQVALEAARRAEIQCFRTNQRLQENLTGNSGVYHGEFLTAARKVSRILGDIPARFDPVGWSPGRTTACKRPHLSHFHKYSARLDVTSEAVQGAKDLLADSPLWSAAALKADAVCSALPSAFTLIKGNVTFTVPKNAKTDRVIRFEPHLNIVLQKQVGQHLKSRLRRFGVDLSDQSINRARARLGSADGSLATIDISSASDSLCRSLVWDLLPYDWAVLLDSLRSKYTWCEGVVSIGEMFSTMGNGFTFELESLIFYALCCSVSHGITVYGDDIVLPSSSYDKVVDLLGFAGFSVNPSKSYASGPFRESCGGDYFCGFDVTPLYLKRLENVSDVLKLHNRLRDWLCRSPGLSSPPSELSLLRKWRDMFGAPSGPTGFGDGHYHCSLDECSPSRAGSQLEGWWFHTYVSKNQYDMRDPIERRSYKDSFPRRDWAGALCASLGPFDGDAPIDDSSRLQDYARLVAEREKSDLDFLNQMSDRSRVELKKTRILVSNWPADPWV